jgi:hypothetical protein
MAKLLRHVPTGDLYPINAELMRRDDMVEYIPPSEEVEVEPVPAPAPQLKAKKKAAKVVKEEPVEQDDMFSDLGDELDTLE